MGGWLSRGWILDQPEALDEDRLTLIAGGTDVKRET